MALDDPALVAPITKFRKSLLACGIKKNAQNAHRGRNKPGIMLLIGAHGPLRRCNGLVRVPFQLPGANDGSDSSRVLLAASEQQPSLL